MDKDYAQSPYTKDTFQARTVRATTIRYLKRKMDLPCGTMLDIGQASPLTWEIKRNFPASVLGPVNTEGDLDTYFEMLGVKCFDYILYSHTIEHQFNPLFTLLQLRLKVMNKDSRLFITTPDRGKLLWCKNHFHEIDRYRMGKLIERAGMKIVSFERHKVWREWWFYLTGIRPLLRLFFEYNAYYEVKI